jgi:hypothetical protein
MIKKKCYKNVTSAVGIFARGANLKKRVAPKLPIRARIIVRIKRAWTRNATTAVTAYAITTILQAAPPQRNPSTT